MKTQSLPRCPEHPIVMRKPWGNAPTNGIDPYGLQEYSGPIRYNPNKGSPYGKTEGRIEKRPNLVNPDLINNCDELLAWIKALAASVRQRLIELDPCNPDPLHVERIRLEYEQLMWLIAYYIENCGGNIGAPVVNPKGPQPIPGKPLYGTQPVPAPSTLPSAGDFLKICFPLKIPSKGPSISAGPSPLPSPVFPAEPWLVIPWVGEPGPWYPNVNDPGLNPPPVTVPRPPIRVQPPVPVTEPELEPVLD